MHQAQPGCSEENSRSRASIACLHCRKRKIRCQDRDASDRCQNCRFFGIECVFMRMGTLEHMPESYTWTSRDQAQHNASNPCDDAWAHLGGHGQLWPSRDAYSGVENPYSYIPPTAYNGLPQAARVSHQGHQTSGDPHSSGHALLPPPPNAANGGSTNPPVWPPRFPPPLAEAPPSRHYSAVSGGSSGMPQNTTAPATSQSRNHATPGARQVFYA